MNLYILGNGFDLAHEIPCSYTDFNCYVCRNHHKKHELYGEMYNWKNTNWLWSDFENRLGKIDIVNCTRLHVARIIKTLTEKHQGKERERLINNFMLNNGLDEDYFNIYELFEEWVKNTLYPIKKTEKIKPIYQFNDDDIFISFNYTTTLEALYGIHKKNICYIHSCVKDEKDLPRLEVGHGMERYEIKEHIENNNNREKVQKIVENYLVETKQTVDFDVTDDIFEAFIDFAYGFKKDTLSNINNNQDFFNCINRENLNKIFILGHSLAPVDLPYFIEIANREQAKKVPWFVSYYKDIAQKKKDLDTLFSKVNKDVDAHIDPMLITLDQLRLVQ